MLGIAVVKDLQGQWWQRLAAGKQLGQAGHRFMGNGKVMGGNPYWPPFARGDAIQFLLRTTFDITVALSRSAFSARFTALVGEPPLTYLTRWRMLRATRLLKNEVGIETIAAQLGYESEAAFRKAFRREMGMPPAQYRRLG